MIWSEVSIDYTVDWFKVARLPGLMTKIKFSELVVSFFIIYLSEKVTFNVYLHSERPFGNWSVTKQVKSVSTVQN